MKVSGCLVVAIAFLAIVQGKKLLKDGKEYTYKSEIRVGTGTMDYAPHLAGSVHRMKTRVQASNGGNTLNIEITDVKKGEYVGPVDPRNQNTDALTFQTAPIGAVTFQVNLNSDGSFKNLKTAATDPEMLNVIKGWASMMQVKKGNGQRSYVSEKEQTLQGECNVQYAVSPQAVYKSVVHVRDCQKRPVRVRDDWGGWNCDMKHAKEKMDGIVSSSNTIFNLADDGATYKIKEIHMHGAIVSHMFESEGVSHLSVTNVTHTLVGEGSGSDISPGGSTYTDISYKFDDANLQWDQSRDLKAREQFFSSGKSMDDTNTAKAVFKSMISKFLETMDNLAERDGLTEENVRKAHFMGINRLAVPIMAMNYDDLKSLIYELKGDSSDMGVKKQQIFGELVGAAGTAPAAKIVIDSIKDGKLEDRDGGRMLSSIPYHVRFPNKDLMDEMGSLLDLLPNLGDDKRFTKMSIPLAVGHMVRRTCERAGGYQDWDTKKACAQTVGRKWVGKFKAMYDSAATKEEKSQALNAIFNMRWGTYSTLKPIIMDKSAEPANRVMALWASFFDLIFSKQAKPLAFSIYADSSEEHEIRIAAVQMIFHAKPSSTDLAQVVAVLRNEHCPELLNFVFSLMERWANDIEPCSKKTAELAEYFLKYMKQLTGYRTDWGFGISKTYKRSFIKNKYGYSGSYTFWTVGSDQSTTPINVGMEIDSTLHHSYKTSLLGVYLRIEGLAKGLIRKFKTMDPSIWKVDDLANILQGQMGITNRPQQPVRVQVTISFKQNIVINRLYDSSSAQQGGSLQTFFSKMKDLGNEYMINHQRVLPVGSVVVEQPNVIGLPTSYVAAFTTMGDIKATIKRGNSKGLQFRKVDYDIKLFTQGQNGLMVKLPGQTRLSRGYLVNQDRIYYAHFPREVTVGLNLIKKEVKISVGRPEYNHPFQLLMHSATYVGRREKKLNSQFNIDPANTVIVSRGQDAIGERDFLDVEDTTSRGHGLDLKGKYFRCEMDIAKSNTVGRGFYAFMPYNKSPRTPWTMFTMGMRQIRAFLIYFPKAQQCGARLTWSQSKTKPVTKVIVSITGKKAPVDNSKDRGFWRAGGQIIRISVDGIGEGGTSDKANKRQWKIDISRKATAGSIKKKTEISIKKKFPNWVVDAAKKGCLKVTYNANYPEFSEQFMGVDWDREMKMDAKVTVKYDGTTLNCDGGTQGDITADATYKTRTHMEDTKRGLEGKWYYKKCMESKNSNAWRGRPETSLPMTTECFMTAYDATVARDYFWHIKFNKVTDRAKNWINKFRTMVNFAAMTFRGEELYSDSNIDLDPELKIHAILKDGDTKADLTIENSRMIAEGTKKEIKDYNLKLGWGPRMLRNLKFGGMVPRLMKMGVIKPCVATIDYVRTMDNVTYSYAPQGANTLMSGHCAENPSYAVFVKKNGGKLAMTAFIGGHKIEIAGGNVKVNGAPFAVESNGPQKLHKQGGEEIFSIFKWGDSYNIYSFLKVWIVFDGSFVEVIPAPSVKGNHCGLCGTYNRNKYDEWTKKDGSSLASSAAEMVQEYQWSG